MADQVWPASLPQSPLLDGFEEKVSKKKIRTEMDQGPAKVRRKQTKKPRPFTMKFVMDLSQLSTFKTFYNDTLKSGSLEFDFKDPRTQQTKEFRFIDEPPTWKPLSKDLYEVSTKMEMLP